MTNIQNLIIEWHRANGGKNIRLAGHALRLLNEAVELCIAAGASPDEIHQRFVDEVLKGLKRAEFCDSHTGRLVVDIVRVRDELADVSVTVDLVAHYSGNVDLENERRNKLVILHQRAWQADADGVLWRPNRGRA